MEMSAKQWIDVCAVADIPARGARIVKTSQGCIAVFRTIDDEIYALEDKCPHKEGPLSQGIVHGRSVTCPLHNWVISLETGEALGPDSGKTETKSLKVSEGRVLMPISIIGAAAA